MDLPAGGAAVDLIGLSRAQSIRHGIEKNGFSTAIPALDDSLFLVVGRHDGVQARRHLERSIEFQG
jgi:hypothetical protein